LKFVAWLTNSKFSVAFPFSRNLLFQIFKIIGVWSRFEANHLLKKVDGKPPHPKLEIDSLRYMLGNYWMDNTKMLNTGFKLEYPDRRVGFVETINCYNENGWERKKLGTIDSIDAEYYKNMNNQLNNTTNCWPDSNHKYMADKTAISNNLGGVRT
jgi:hypothetical protein